MDLSFDLTKRVLIMIFLGLLIVYITLIITPDGTALGKAIEVLRPF